MTKIAYTVTCIINNPHKAEEWLDWLRSGHIQDVLAGGASGAEIVKYEDNKYDVRYIFPSRPLYETYIRDHAPRLREEGLKKFPSESGFSYSRTAGEIIS